MADLISDTDITNFIRSLIGEATAEYWTDAEITLYKKFGMMAVMAKYWYLLYPTHKSYSDVDKTSGTDYISIPTNAIKVGKIEIYDNGDGNGKQLKYIEEDEIYKFATWDAGDPVAWTFRNDSSRGKEIALFPTPNSTATSYYRIWYLKGTTTTTDLPEALRPLVAIEAVMLAKYKDEDVDAGLLRLQERFEKIAYDYLATAQIGEPQVIGDYELEDHYTAQSEE